MKKGDFYFDFIISFASIEHSGLGRYGEIIHPFADLFTMGKFWCSTKVGTKLILAITSSYTKDEDIPTIWNINRYYGKFRMSFITANWDQIDRIEDTDAGIYLLEKVAYV